MLSCIISYRGVVFMKKQRYKKKHFSYQRQKLGQHFLFDPSILERIIRVAGIEPGDTVVEIGPGKGDLTTLLSEKAEEVIAIEYDMYLCNQLRERFPETGKIKLYCGDALKYPYRLLPPFKVVANIPYYITTPIIFRLLEVGDRLISATITVQNEVAERIVASPGGKDYGVLSVMVQYYTEPEIAFRIPGGAFVPPPRVDSAVIHLKTLSGPRVSVSDEKIFFRIVRTAFSQRRKTLANSLKPLKRDTKALLVEAGIDPARRPETLSMEEFARIAEILTERLKPKSA
jgi:16S rRNA (adenine1518-N6/adenine1519-N6)-dimethyltransferase